MRLLSIHRVLTLCFILSPLAKSEQPETQSVLTTGEEEPYNIAIIGAGAAGCSAAYHLVKFFPENELDRPLKISLYDTASRVGGRTTTVHAFNDPQYPVELGGSIFVKINHILYNATRDFGLSTRSLSDFQDQDSKYNLGVWDGTQFVFTTSNGGGTLSGLWAIAKLIWKYGMSAFRVRNLAQKAVGQFLQFYERPIFPFETLQDAVNATGLLDFTSATGAQVLAGAGVSELFAREIVQASTRVNYAQNLIGIHGLEAMVCMSTDGAIAIEGGNWQIFDEMVKKSVHDLHLETRVTEVHKDGDGFYHLIGEKSTKNLDVREGDDTIETELSSTSFDAVILAAPLQFANITFKPELSNPPAPIAYVSLHVTLFTSPLRPSPAYFNLQSQSEVPNTVLSTLPKDFQLSDDDRNAIGPVPFWSISTLGLIPASATRGEQYLYKIFSPSPLRGTLLARILGAEIDESQSSLDPITSLPESVISWSHEKAWHSYPYEIPRTEFENFRIDPAMSSSDKHSHDPQTENFERGIWYTSVIEPFISTMETSALSGMNVAQLILSGFRREEQRLGGVRPAESDFFDDECGTPYLEHELK